MCIHLEIKKLVRIIIHKTYMILWMVYHLLSSIHFYYMFKIQQKGIA